MVMHRMNRARKQCVLVRWGKDDDMMPLTMAGIGEVNTIKRIAGKDKSKKFLENLGFVPGGRVTVVSEVGGNMILNVKDSRIALGKDMANKIMI